MVGLYASKETLNHLIIVLVGVVGTGLGLAIVAWGEFRWDGFLVPAFFTLLIEGGTILGYGIGSAIRSRPNQSSVSYDEYYPPPDS